MKFKKGQVTEYVFTFLQDELERQHERVREVQHEMAKRIADERASAERRYTYHVDQLGGDLSSQWEHATKLQLEVERMKRIESDYKRELNQKSSQIDELKMELKNKSAIFMSDLNQASAEKQSLEQEITSLRYVIEGVVSFSIQKICFNPICMADFNWSVPNVNQRWKCLV